MGEGGTAVGLVRLARADQSQSPLARELLTLDAGAWILLEYLAGDDGGEFHMIDHEFLPLLPGESRLGLFSIHSEKSSFHFFVSKDSVECNIHGD